MKNIYNSKFAILKKTKKPLIIKNLSLPKLEKNQILVKIKYSYICGTQLNEIFGLKGKDKYLPHVLGHEASGVILKIGPGVKSLRKGQKVILSWIKKKSLNNSENPYYIDIKNNKKINSGPVSTFSNLSIVSQDRIYKVPKNFPMDIAALFGCAIPTGFGIVLNFLKLKKLNKDDFVGIYGVGGVGIMSLIALNALGIKNIYAVDKNKKNLKLANKIGCKYIGDLNKINKIIASNKININKIKFNFEISGSKIMIENAIKNLNKDGKIIFAGNPKKGDSIKLNPYDLIFGKKIFGFSGNDVSLENNLMKYSKIIKKTNFNKLRAMFSVYKFENINKAIIDFKRGKILRPLLKF